MKKEEKYFVVADTYESGRGEMGLEGDNTVYCGGCRKRFYSSFDTGVEKWERECGGKTGRRFWQCDKCESWNTTVTLDIGTVDGERQYENLPKITKFNFIPKTEIVQLDKNIKNTETEKIGNYWLLEIYLTSGRKIEFVCQDTKEGRKKIRNRYELIRRNNWEEYLNGIDDRLMSINSNLIEQVELNLINKSNNK